jgi:SPP1 family holin
MEQKVNTETIIRTVVLAITLINQALTSSGKNPLPFAESELYEFLSLGATICAAIWAWWKNNSFTKAAIKADGYMKALKKLNKTTKGKVESE